MPWSTSTRRSRLPPDWRKRRETVARRAGGQCEWITDGDRCTAPGAECDHIVPDTDGGSHRMENLRWLCTGHHKQVTATQRPPQPSRRRPPERHPGLINIDS